MPYGSTKEENMKDYIVRVTQKKTQEIVVKAKNAEEAKARAVASVKAQSK